MRFPTLVLAAAGLVAAASVSPPEAHAQSRFSLELRGSLNNPVGDFGDEGGLEATGEASLAADLMFNLNDNLTLYGGYGREMYGCESCGDDEGLHSQGFEGGVKLLANRDEGILPWLRAGFVAHDLTADFGPAEVTSDTGLGFQAAAGVDIPLGEVLSFAPAVRYQTFDAEFDVVGDDFVVTETTVQQVALDFGLHLHLGALANR